MKKFVLASIACLLFFSIEGWAKTYKVSDITMVHLQDKTRYVCNPDGILSTAAVARMDSALYALEQSTGIETLVVAVGGIGGGDCFDFAYRLGEQNGVGKKKSDNGLVVLLSTEERCIQFVTGYGLEGVLPDAICKRIQSQKMNSCLAQGDWDNGMVAGVMALCGYLDGSMEAELEEEEDEGFYILCLSVAFIMLVIGGCIAYGWYSGRKQRRCPQCKKYALQRSNTQLISRNLGVRHERVTYICTHCGHVVTRDEKRNDPSSGGIGGMGGGPIIFGSGRGGGFHGGGFSGGHFGGGHFGGGGAGSRF